MLNMVVWLATTVTSTTGYLPWYLGHYRVFRAEIRCGLEIRRGEQGREWNGLGQPAWAERDR